MTVDAMEVAQRAEVAASTALARIGSHEVNCERRYQENTAIQREIRDELRALTARVEIATHAPTAKANERTWMLKLGLFQAIGAGAVLAVLKLFHLG